MGLSCTVVMFTAHKIIFETLCATELIATFDFVTRIPMKICDSFQAVLLLIEEIIYVSSKRPYFCNFFEYTIQIYMLFLLNKVRLRVCPQHHSQAWSMSRGPHLSPYNCMNVECCHNLNFPRHISLWDAAAAGHNGQTPQ